MKIEEIKDELVRTFRVLEDGKEIAQVWYSNGVARCVQCSGPLVAMSSSCRHACAVARYAKKHLTKRALDGAKAPRKSKRSTGSPRK